MSQAPEPSPISSSSPMPMPASYEHEVSDRQEREVMILMVPVKDISRLQKAISNLIHITLGSMASLGWCMHWIIRVDDSSFELKRYTNAPYTRLAASTWDSRRNSEIVHSIRAGRTLWTDEQIQALSDQYFEQNLTFQYDLYINNCQTFVSKVAADICGDGTNKNPMSVPIYHILAQTAARAYAISAMSVLKLVFRFRGCDAKTLREYEYVSQWWSYFMLPTILHTPITAMPVLRSQLAETLSNEKIESVMFRYITTMITSVGLFGLFFCTPLAQIWATHPWPRKHPQDGKWRLSYRPRRLPHMDANAVWSIRELDEEEHTNVFKNDPNVTITEEEGRWDVTEPKDLPKWYLKAFVVVAITASSCYWTLHFLKLLIRWLLGIIRNILRRSSTAVEIVKYGRSKCDSMNA